MKVPDPHILFCPGDPVPRFPKWVSLPLAQPGLTVTARGLLPQLAVDRVSSIGLLNVPLPRAHHLNVSNRANQMTFAKRGSPVLT